MIGRGGGKVAGFHLPILAAALAVIAMLPACSSDKGTGPDAVNHAPVIEHMRDTTAVLGDTLYIQVEASDPDGDHLHFNLVVQCSWAELQQGHCPLVGIRSRDLMFWFWPRTFDISLREFIIEVDDGRGGRDSTSFNVAVRAG